MKSNPQSNDFLNELQAVVDDDVRALRIAQQNYGASWKKRGGVGAFMMLARKWDRLEKRVEYPPSEHVGPHATSPTFSQYDIFGAIETDNRPEGIIDDIRDLRRYLTLVEAEARAAGFAPAALEKDMTVDMKMKPDPQPQLGAMFRDCADEPTARQLHPT